ncbi:uncharacterized protein LOC113306009 [Papaver somniferum]|uniref:uncharacterized protein LOC113306009 n=1 Tax=Papaver somniferum TaxID=3469 RepID=UPI000E6FAD3D|nr:uncharacterized protein LOC113306009 [Papaver somniferum]
MRVVDSVCKYICGDVRLHGGWSLVAGGDIIMVTAENAGEDEDSKSETGGGRIYMEDKLKMLPLLCCWAAERKAPRAWYGKLASLDDTSFFVQKLGKRLTIVLVYVDDILVTENDTAYITAFISELNNHFPVKDLGALHYFLGLEVSISSVGIFLSQFKYILDLIKKTNMVGCKPCSSPAVANAQLTYEGDLLPDPSSYTSIVGALHYFTWSRPEISFAVQQVCQFMSQPTTHHLTAVHRILRYLKGHIDFGICFTKGPMTLHGYSDADWAGAVTDSRSIGGFCIYFGSNPISWSAKKQATVSRSSTESEYKALVIAAAESYWICRLLIKDLHFTLSSSSRLGCDNVSSISLASNPVMHSKMKSLGVDFHYVRELVRLKLL